jgi:hypothetical protein
LSTRIRTVINTVMNTYLIFLSIFQVTALIQRIYLVLEEVYSAFRYLNHEGLNFDISTCPIPLHFDTTADIEKVFIFANRYLHVLTLLKFAACCDYPPQLQKFPNFRVS